MNTYPENPPEDLICKCGRHLPCRHCEPSGEGLGASACSPVPVLEMLIENLKDVACQHRCGCAHPACRQCREDRASDTAIAAGEAWVDLYLEANARSEAPAPTSEL